MKYFLRLFLFFLLLPMLACAQDKAPVFPKAQATIITASGEHRFQVELALTPPQHEYGLMFRRYLAPNAGMLFIFPQPRRVSFWMKNTFIPLDMLFINGQGAVVAVVENAVPQSETPISPDNDNVIGVLEVAGGTVQRLGIAIGNQVKTSNVVQ